MPILGIDYGLKKIGLAIADSHGQLAVPLKTLLVNSPEDALAQLKEIIDSEQIDYLVMGVPVGNHDQAQEQLTRSFIKTLEQAVRVPVMVEDERLSTKAAQELQGSSHDDDAVAAMLILQTHLDKKSHGDDVSN